jgi:integrase
MEKTIKPKNGIQEITRSKGIVYKAKAYLPSSGKTKTRTFKNKTEARKWKEDFESQKRRDPLGIMRQPLKISFHDLFSEWMSMKVQSKRDPKTVYLYAQCYKKHFHDRFNNKLVLSFKSDDGEQLVKDLLKNGLMPKTVNNILTLLKQIFNFAVTADYILKSPLKNVNQLQEPQRSYDYLHKQEINMLLRSNQFETIFPIISLAVNTGMRLGEILGLCWDCVSFETNQVLVKRTLCRKVLSETTKTKRIRQIPMNSAVKALLADLFKKQKNCKFVLTRNNGEPLSTMHFSDRIFKDALERAQIKRIRFHDLRHTYASQFMMNGGNLYDLQKILGHSTSEQTAMYAHLSPDHLANAVKIVNFELEPTQDILTNEKKLDSSYLVPRAELKIV